MAKVIRVLVYEGSIAAVGKALAMSKSEGVHDYDGYSMQVITHYNDLPQPLTHQEILKAIETSPRVVPPPTPPLPAFTLCPECGVLGGFHKISCKWQPIGRV